MKAGPPKATQLQNGFLYLKPAVFKPEILPLVYAKVAYILRLQGRNQGYTRCALQRAKNAILLLGRIVFFQFE